MIHHSIKSNHNHHYAVGISSPYIGKGYKHEGGILLQVAEDDQSRILLTIEETQHLIGLLQDNILLYDISSRNL
jgi:hypothetical protein